MDFDLHPGSHGGIVVCVELGCVDAQKGPVGQRVGNGHFILWSDERRSILADMGDGDIAALAQPDEPASIQLANRAPGSGPVTAIEHPLGTG